MTAKPRSKPRRKQQPSTNGKFLDGTITIEVQGGTHDGKTIHMDAAIVQAAAEQLATKHKLKISDGSYQPTPEFLLELDKRLQELGYDSTPTIARHAWIKASEYFTEIQKKTSQSPS